MLLPPGSVWWKVSSIGLYGSAGAINASPPPSSGRNHISCDQPRIRNPGGRISIYRVL